MGFSPLRSSLQSTRLWLPILVAAALFTLLACDHGKNTAQANDQNQAAKAESHAPLSFPADTGPPPTFDGNRAMQYVKEIVAFGPRPIGSANHKKVEDYITSHLNGDAVEDDTFTADTPEGKFPVHN